MANRRVFANKVSASAPASNTVNEAGGRAYDLGAKHSLAQLACTGTFSNTFYTKAEDQVAKVLELAKQCEPEFVGKVAIYAREHAFMKDMPAYLVAYLTMADPSIFREVFPRVIDNGKMLRNFVQIIRSGVVGRRSLGHAPQKMVQLWLETHDDEQVFRASVGNDPSLADIINLARPRPMTQERAALYAHLLGRKTGKFEGREFTVADSLPGIVAAYEQFKKSPSETLPDVPFEMLTGLDLNEDAWKEVARRASWAQTRQNLATFARHGVLQDREMVRLIANRLRDEKLIQKAHAFPYQLMMAYYTTQDNSAVPIEITNALQDAMEIATTNTPTLDGQVYVFPDISGSMSSPATGDRGDAGVFRGGRMVSSTTKVSCLMVAALVASTILRKNPSAVVWPFESKALTDVRLNPRDSIMTNAKKLSNLPCGGTDCSAPLKELARRGDKADLVVYVSDNESWLDSDRYGSFAGGGYGRNTPNVARTETMNAWGVIKKRNPKAKMVCLDITPYTTSQTVNRPDILNLGGFSDACFDVIAAFCRGSTENWVETIEKVTI